MRRAGADRTFAAGLAVSRLTAPSLPIGTFDVAVIGGGLVGSSIALGLTGAGARVAVLDEDGRAHRASRGNFGLVWVQGKGAGRPDYARISRRAADSWADFAAMLRDLAGVDVGHRRTGGHYFCHGEAAFEARRAMLAGIEEATGGLASFEMLDRDELAHRLPGIGPTIHGSSWTPHDGGADPLKLLRALHAGLGIRGGRPIATTAVDAIRPDGDAHEIRAGGATIRAARVVLAAGLGNARLAPLVGLAAPVRPVRGQILVTERLAPFLEPVSNMLHQMPEGTLLVGDTAEEVGFDDGVLVGSAEKLAARAVAVFPALARARLVRTWGALRVMTPDGLPIWERSRSRPGAWLATVHSGVTLAPFHHDVVARAILEEEAEPLLAPFAAERFAAAVDAGTRA
jgi:glycine/D-amino acid oxidase-like deaminating enzyme